MTIKTGYSVTLNENTTGANGYTLADVFAVAALTIPTEEIIRVRVTVEASSAKAYTITNMYIGHGAASGDAYDFLATPVQILFSASASLALTAGQSVVSDWAEFRYNKTSPLVAAWYQNGGTSVDGLRGKLTGVTSVDRYGRAATNEAATVNKTTGYTLTASSIFLINKIEFDVSSGFFF